jgi:GT2 family glycosyltransferase
MIGGFNPDLRAGEDYEMCLRLRRKGGKIARLDAEMAVHDAGSLGFRKWWQRSQRDGYGYAEVAAMYRGEPDTLWQRDVRSAWLWGFWLPAVIISVVAIAGRAGWLLLAAYPTQASRVFLRARRKLRAGDAALYAASCVIAKFPQVVGQLRFELGPSGRAGGFGRGR